MWKKRVVAATLMFAAVGLAGCTADFVSDVEARTVVTDSMLSLTIDDVAGELTYEDLLIIVNDVPWRLGPEDDYVARMYSVDDKDNQEDRVAIGDVVRVPVTGQVSVELRDRSSGASFQELDAFVPDNSAPAQVSPLTPGAGESEVSKQAVFIWAAVKDPSGVEYQLEYWIGNPATAAGTTRIAGLAGSSYAVPASEALLPQTTYHWHVRAADGFGNLAPWSDVKEFQTGA